MAKPAWENYGSQFVYILGPIFTMFRCLGIEPHRDSSIKNRRTFLVLRLLAPLLALSWCGYRVFYWFPVKLVLNSSTAEAGTARLHFIIEYLNYWLYNLLIILGVFYFVKCYANQMWLVTEDMLHHIPLEPNDLESCRRISVRCICGCVVVVTIFLMFSKSNMNKLVLISLSGSSKCCKQDGDSNISWTALASRRIQTRQRNIRLFFSIECLIHKHRANDIVSIQQYSPSVGTEMGSTGHTVHCLEVPASVWRRLSRCRRAGQNIWFHVVFHCLIHFHRVRKHLL